MPNYHELGRHTPDLRDDYAEDDPGFITVQRGRLFINKYGDGDADDAEIDCEMIHDRRNVMPLPDAPDPYFKRHAL
jgi:hypothetical protein